MAWSWWWARRRRRPWTRRRWRRLRTRRPRRPVRRRRRRKRRVRRRRWGRRRGRRTFYRRRFRKRRRRRKKLVLTQWNPQTIRACSIRGTVCLVMCGHTKASRNYALHSEDYVPQLHAMGGSFSTTTWSLKALYDEHQKFHNRWSYPNTQLDLARYRGCRWWFYRDPKVDYIVTYYTVPPFKINKYTSPMLHPGMMMQYKKKILVPSYQTKPKGKSKISVFIKPPVLFEDKWYTQQDLCPVNLMSLAVSAASFIHPFCPPESDNMCITFQVLKEFYYEQMGVTTMSGETLTPEDQRIFTKLYTTPSYWQSLHTQSQISTTQKPAKHNATKFPNSNNWLSGDPGNNKFKTGNNSIYGLPNYAPNETKMHEIRKWYFDQKTTENAVHGQYGKPLYDAVDYHVGKYSCIFLSPYRTNLQFDTAYQDTTYNPNTDKGLGNKMWIQSVTKKDTELNSACRCLIEDIPLWAMATGYGEFCESEINSEVWNLYIVCIICPYTRPQLYSKRNPKQGWVFYDTLFGDGKMPTGSGLVPVWLQSRWYPRLVFQQQVLHDIYLTGPFSYKDDLKSFTINARYKFKFLWGGTIIPEQVIKNPCKEQDSPFTFTGRQPRDLQVADPQTMGPQWVFHTWDWRRGLFGENALKRVSEQPSNDADYYAPPKKPRLFPPTDLQEQERGSDFTLQELRILSERAPSEQSEEEEPQTEHELQQQELQLRLQQQFRIRQQLQHLFVQVLKTQAGLHINPLFLNPA
uniref:Capsid protein n=1 Tax=Alphatorquevirus homin21 TaxID=3048423 RepID=A0AAU8H6V7_9VIRU